LACGDIVAVEPMCDLGQAASLCVLAADARDHLGWKG
jgi:hypothetical protein